ncbi:MAG: hypothetical protein V2I74_12445 [Erythrobacter sp.]|jgi:hypothetical protein|nr:hypothetical protein [Erythrobacter sp.]
MSASFTDAQLAAFLEGRLEDEALIDAIEAAINTNPALAARAETLAGGDGLAPLVQSAFVPLLDAPVPERLTAAVAMREGGAGAEVVNLGSVRSRALPMPASDFVRGNWGWTQIGAMAASLALGVLIGGPLLKGGADAPQGDGLILASAQLDTMLDTVPSGQAADLASLGTGEVVLTFRDTEGRLCRQFKLEAAGGATSDALACAGADRTWQIEAYGRREAPLGEMRLAGGDAAPAVLAAVDAVIDGEPLTGADETAQLSSR